MVKFNFNILLKFTNSCILEINRQISFRKTTSNTNCSVHPSTAIIGNKTSAILKTSATRRNIYAICKIPNCSNKYKSLRSFFITTRGARTKAHIRKCQKSRKSAAIQAKRFLDCEAQTAKLPISVVAIIPVNRSHRMQLTRIFVIFDRSRYLQNTQYNLQWISKFYNRFHAKVLIYSDSTPLNSLDLQQMCCCHRLGYTCSIFENRSYHGFVYKPHQAPETDFMKCNLLQPFWSTWAFQVHFSSKITPKYLMTMINDHKRLMVL